MDYFEIKVKCQKSLSENLEESFLNLGACSVTFRDAEDVAILEPAPGEMPLWKNLDVTGMFTEDFNQDKIVSSLQKDFPDSPIQSKALENQVWERVWLKHFKPMLFGKNTWIIPSEYELVDRNAVNIFLDPGLAFGTGTHATTALCLDWIDTNDVNGKVVMDFGCGSGILAIAALKHGANVTYCTDIDPQAIESTLNNAQANSVEKGIKVVQPNEFEQIEKQDVILANILAAPLLTLVEVFYNLSKPNAQLIMSGILKEQEQQIIERYNSHFTNFKVSKKEDWISIYMRRKDDVHSV